jgi:hypothetical protein
MSFNLGSIQCRDQSYQNADECCAAGGARRIHQSPFPQNLKISRGSLRSWHSVKPIPHKCHRSPPSAPGGELIKVRSSKIQNFRAPRFARLITQSQSLTNAEYLPALHAAHYSKTIPQRRTNFAPPHSGRRINQNPFPKSTQFRASFRSANCPITHLEPRRMRADPGPSFSHKECRTCLLD